jgi:hypothetical protein
MNCDILEIRRDSKRTAPVPVIDFLAESLSPHLPETVTIEFVAAEGTLIAQGNQPASS